jgi:glycosyltransferase involved in cell wall biosynthesis
VRLVRGPGVSAGMQRFLSIVVPIHSFEPGGVERVGLNLAKAWRDCGHEVRVVLGRDEGLDRLQAPALAYVTLRGLVPTARFETIWMIWCLFLHLKRHRADIIFCPGNTYAVVCVAMRLLLGSRCPPIVAKVSNDLVRMDKSGSSRAAYRVWTALQGVAFDRIVGMAEPMREEISRYMDVPAPRIAIVPDPALTRERAHALFAIARSQDRGPAVRFLAVGRIVSQKNFALMLEAFAKGRRPGDSLTIVGDGPQRALLQRLSTRLGLAGVVRFTGHLLSPDAEYARADCLLLSSDYEGVPAVVIEAIAAGLPVIVTDCSLSMAELLGHGTRGVLVPPRDCDALADGIASALSLPFLSPSMRRYAQGHTVEDAGEQYLGEMRRAVFEHDQSSRENCASEVRRSKVRGV